MTQRWIEIVVGRLVTDEDFRRRFLANPSVVIEEIVDRGTHLTQAEITALFAVESRVWDQVARDIDPRLQKAREG